MTDPRVRARELAAEATGRGEPLAWFEEFYREAAGNSSAIPWADRTVNPNLAEWLARSGVQGEGRTALVVGCGLGDDAEALAARGYRVTAFDLSETCIAWCQKRFLESTVSYRAADLLHPPDEWGPGFDFVLESYTLQALPDELRPDAMRRVAAFVRPGGTLLVIARGRDDADAPGSVPWPLTRTELEVLRECGLEVARFEDYVEPEEEPVRRFRIEYRRPANGA